MNDASVKWNVKSPFWLEFIHAVEPAFRFSGCVCGTKQYAAVRLVHVVLSLISQIYLLINFKQYEKNATIFLIVTEFTFFLFVFIFRSIFTTDLLFLFVLDGDFNHKMLFMKRVTKKKIRLLYFLLAIAIFAERLSTLTIFCSSIKKARTIRSRTHWWQSTPPYVRATVFWRFEMRERSNGRVGRMPFNFSLHWPHFGTFLRFLTYW